jgi:hypothetical protein
MELTRLRRGYAAVNQEVTQAQSGKVFGFRNFIGLQFIPDDREFLPRTAGFLKMANAKHPIFFWVIIVFLIVSMVLLLMGQTMAIFNYGFAVKLGLQEHVKEVSEFGVQINRAFGVGDTFVYIPLMAISLVGLFLKKRWSLVTTAAVMGVSGYWATTVGFILFFLPGCPTTILSQVRNTGFSWVRSLCLGPGAFSI